MNRAKSSVTRLTQLFLILLLASVGFTQTANIKPASADDGTGYPWSNATYVDANYDWGYSACPTNDTGCMTFYGWLSGVKYGEADPWLYYLRNCTSYVAWKIANVFSKGINGWGNAASWNTNAISAGYTNDTTPREGDIAQWDATGGNPYGHAAYVLSVNGGVATYAENNYAGDGNFTNTYTSASNSQGPPSHWIHISDISPPPPPTPPPYLLVRQGSNLIGKANLSDQWINPLGTGATDVTANSGRIVIRDGTGNLVWKNGISGNWWPLQGPSDQFIVTPYLAVIRQGNVIKAMDWSVGIWKTVASNAAVHVEAADHYIIWTDTFGNVMGRWGADVGGYVQITGGASEFDVTTNLLVVRQGDVIKAKDWAVGTWYTVASNAAVSVKASGHYIAWPDTFGTLYARYGAGVGGYAQTAAGAQYDVTEDMLVVRQGGAIVAKAWSVGQWKTPATNAAVDVKASGNRIAWMDSFGTLWAREGADNGGGLNETSSVTQYVLAGTE